jgi:hypothetical protein
LSYSIGRLAQETDVGRSSIYEEIGAQRLVARKIGRRTIVRRSDAIRWLRSLPILGQHDRDHLDTPGEREREPARHAAEHVGS